MDVAFTRVLLTSTSKIFYPQTTGPGLGGVCVGGGGGGGAGDVGFILHSYDR